MFGHLVLTKKPPEKFTEDDESVLIQLAHIASVAIENARLYDELREANRRKDEFLAMLAHELRNPLAPIGNALQILRLGGVNGEVVAKAREKMERQLGQLVRLVNDLLDVSRISRGKIELKRERVELESVVRQAAEMCQALADYIQLEMIVSVPETPIFLDADPMRLAQVLGNLLNNACKFSEPGSLIRLTATQEGGEAVIRVIDKGIGIPQSQLSRVFEMFVQVDNSLEKSQGGLGIGLTLARRLVELHGGTIEARSEGLGQGCELIVRLPLASANASQPPNQSDHECQDAMTAKLRVLVVDDNKDSAESLAMLLKLRGHEVVSVHDGPEALKLAEEFRPDLILLDIGLPGMNGYDVAQKIRHDLRMSRVTLAALTGWGQEEDRRRSKEAGFNHHLVKPVNSDDLMKLLNGLRDISFDSRRP
jgi:signal transduction histidine kinase/ActR/RegA family two-component response regulator